METTFKLEAIKILKKAEKSLSADEITKEIIKRGNVKIISKTPKATLYAIIVTDIKKNGNKSDFIKTEKGFTLR